MASRSFEQPSSLGSADRLRNRSDAVPRIAPPPTAPGTDYGSEMAAAMATTIIVVFLWNLKILSAGPETIYRTNGYITWPIYHNPTVWRDSVWKA